MTRVKDKDKGGVRRLRIVERKQIGKLGHNVVSQLRLKQYARGVLLFEAWLASCDATLATKTVELDSSSLNMWRFSGRKGKAQQLVTM